MNSNLVAAGALVVLGAAGIWWVARDVNKQRCKPARVRPAEFMRPFDGTTRSPQATPAEVVAFRSPLQPLLDRALDGGRPSLPATASAKVANAEEARVMAQFVVGRVNRASPRAGLALVAVESAQVAEHAGVRRYEMLLNVFSATLTMAARVLARVVADGDRVYLESATAEGGAMTPTGPVVQVQGSLGPATEEDYAGFEPVI